MIILLVPVFTCSVQLWKLDSSIETAESCPAMARSSTWNLADFETGVEVYALQRFKVSGEIGEIILYLHEFLVWASFLSPALSQFVTDCHGCQDLKGVLCVFAFASLSSGRSWTLLPASEPTFNAHLLLIYVNHTLASLRDSSDYLRRQEALLLRWIVVLTRVSVAPASRLVSL